MGGPRLRGMTKEQKDACRRRYGKRWKADNHDKTLEYRARYRDRQKLGQLNDPIQNYARSALNYAIYKGRIDRGYCEVCGAPDAHGHHSDYLKPLDVTWLCPAHHIELHKTMRKARIRRVRRLLWCL
jgi:hypothetical protein